VKIKLIIIMLVSLIYFIGCEKSSEPGEDELVIFRGTVYVLGENQIPIPLDGVLVTAKGYYVQTKTNNQGEYEISIELDNSEETASLQLEFTKVGYQLVNHPVEGKKGELILVSDLIMTQVTGSDDNTPPGGKSEDAAHIEIYGKHSSHIYVQSSGLRENAMIQFVVTDAKGVRVDVDHKVLVNFLILNGPGGGEFLYPDTMTTSDGFVYLVLNSGKISGVVQIEASFESGGKLYRSLPIRIAIYGGMPDKEHFSLGLDRINIAGHVHLGIIDYVTAFVGDKFSNPVAPGTAVYFYTDYGIIDGSAVTDEMGRATVRYMSAFPLPPQPAIESLALITASTYEDTIKADDITVSTSLLLTGPTDPIQVTPPSFTYSDSHTSKTFNYTVSDIWGYPLVGKTTIQVEATEGGVYGDVNIILNDTQASGPSRTQFSFSWAPHDEIMLTPEVYISITVKPPDDGNGYQSVKVVGTRQ